LGSRRVYVPTSLIGLAYFLSLAIWFAMVGHLPARERWLWRLTLLTVSLGLAGSLFFTGLMAFVLPEWCPPCLIIHILNAGVFGCTVWMWRLAQRRPEVCAPADSPAPDHRHRVHRTRAGWAVVVAAGASVSVWLYFDSMTEVRRQWRKAHDLVQVVRSLQNDRSIVLQEYFEQPVVGALHGAAGLEEVDVAGAPAPEVVVFTGHDCHGCKCFEPHQRELIERAFSGEVRVDYRYLPAVPEEADSIGVETDRTSYSDAAWAAATAAAAAKLQGPEAFRALHAILLKHRDEHPHPGWLELARRAGLDVSRFESDVSRSDVRAMAQRDVDLATRLRVSRLPAVFLNGRQVPDLCVTSPVFWVAIAEELAEGPMLEAASTVAAKR
jgi:predicted DsbA family dithiol-disulfide isomerase